MGLVIRLGDKGQAVNLSVLSVLTFQKLTEEEYHVAQCSEDKTLVIQNSKEPKLTLKVILTSPQYREEENRSGGGIWVFLFPV